jgi:DNA polymerase-1
MSTKKQLIVIDGNALLHRAFHAYPFLSTTTGEQVNAVYGFTIMLMQVLEKFKPPYIAVTFDKKGPTFRHQEFTQYKAQRKPMDEGLSSQIARTYELVHAFNIPIFAVDGYEADDLIGTLSELATDNKLRTGSDLIDEVLIVTGDRDLLQLLSDRVKAFMPGKTFSEGSVVDVASFEAKWGFKPIQLIDFKALRGDASDNIPGVHGIGDVGATKLIQKFESLEGIYAHLNEIDEKTRHKLEESAEMALLSKKLATIDTHAPVQFDLAAAKTEDFDRDKVRELFNVLEFKSLAKRIDTVANALGVSPSPVSKKSIQNGAQQSLLDHEVEQDAPKEEITEKERLQQFLKDQPKEIVAIDLTMVDVLERMCENGILVDREVLAILSKRFGTKLEVLTQEIYEAAGHEFNINSSKQLAEVLFDHLKLPVLKKTKTGRSTDEEVLSELALASPVAEKVLEYRALYKLKSTYIDSLPKHIKEDGRIHSQFHLDVAATGRLSSTDPNLQNIPIRGQWGNDIRKAFISRPGYVLLACDYSQIELRILAHLSEDPGLKAIFQEDKDVHASTAAVIFNSTPDQVTKDQRRSAKAINFGLMYGMGARSLAKDLKITHGQAQLFIKAYFDAFPKVKQWIEGVLQKGREQGYVETIMGRRRYLPELQSPEQRLRAAGERMAINMPAQGTQAEMIKLAMIHLDQIIQSGFVVLENGEKIQNAPDEIFMELQVHDELIFEVKESLVSKWVPIVQKEMREALPLSVPVKVGANIGKSWGEMKEF